MDLFKDMREMVATNIQKMAICSNKNAELIRFVLLQNEKKERFVATKYLLKVKSQNTKNKG